jgi:hypothetical protein
LRHGRVSKQNANLVQATAQSPGVVRTLMTVIINGYKINSLQDFYRELEPYLLEGECPWGENLDSLDEIVGCKFNYTDDPEKDATKVIWTNSLRSKQMLGEEETIRWWHAKGRPWDQAEFPKTLFETLVEILSRTDGPGPTLS